ncbi:MAG: hypothetical protein LBU51_05745, partial [Bacteroidales bacterium]|nr:hypothetical protein [Bacteroidales bacterium]
IVLSDRQNGERLIDFVITENYNFTLQEPQNRELQLKFFKDKSSLSDVKTSSINIKHIGDEVIVYSDSKIEMITLTNLDGRTIKRLANTNKIKIPNAGLFLLSVQTKDCIKIFKIKTSK